MPIVILILFIGLPMLLVSGLAIYALRARIKEKRNEQTDDFTKY